jgi:hypothetical protein
MNKLTQMKMMNKINLKWVWPAVAAMLFGAIYAFAPQSETIRFSTPLYANQMQADKSAEPGKSATMVNGDEAGNVPWLHVTVETKYTWFSQTSVGKAWTTKTRESEERVNVGLLCIELNAHNTLKSCLPDTSYIEIKDVKRRVATKKKTAIVTAWAENPEIKATTVSLEP